MGVVLLVILAFYVSIHKNQLIGFYNMDNKAETKPKPETNDEHIDENKKSNEITITVVGEIF